MKGMANFGLVVLVVLVLLLSVLLAALAAHDGAWVSAVVRAAAAALMMVTLWKLLTVPGVGVGGWDPPAS